MKENIGPRVVHLLTFSDLLQADALFSPRTTFNDLEVLPGRYRCDVSGVGMMVKKDSELPVWWNPAFQKYYMSGRYNDACDQINQKYGGMFINYL